MELRVASPPGYEPNADVLRWSRDVAGRTGAILELTDDPAVAVSGADAVYTDVWTSMGQEAEAEARRVAFAAFQVNQELLDLAAPHAIFLHCLPAHRGEEVTDDVLDGPASRVWDQAENRMHTETALLAWLLGAAA
jgi:ornithine carbamoyltransferase